MSSISNAEDELKSIGTIGIGLLAGGVTALLTDVSPAIVMAAAFVVMALLTYLQSE